MGLAELLLPDFIGIGAMRAGTSWFARNLAKHPQIEMRAKEIHFFDTRMERSKLSRTPDSPWFRLYYAKWFIGGNLKGKVTGEYTPAYAILPPERIALIRKWMPEVRLLFCMRNPIDRAWSHARKDFPQFFDKTVDEATHEELLNFFRSDGVVRRGDYASCLENWLRYYPREQIHIAYLEEISQDPLGVLREAFEFLGVDPHADFDQSQVGTPVNSRPTAPMPDEIEELLRDTLVEQTTRLSAVTGRSPPW